ncbi:MAG: magnesium-translocating P-type ATPase [Candidatus Methanosuratincola petrocarbonis]
METQANPEELACIPPSIKTEELASISLEEVFSRLRSSPSGLTSEEADSRLQVCGRNEIARRKKRSAVVDFLSHFKSPLLVILIFAAVLSGILGELINTGIVLSIVLISVILDYYQEAKAESAAQLLREKVTTTATVMRDLKRQEVDLAEIVPGDVIYLSAGDIVPADARVIAAKDLFVNQSSLTGESIPVEKMPGEVALSGVPMEEWRNLLFMGTSVVSGTGKAVVVRTGANTEFGKIARKLVGRAPETDFERGLKGFGYMIMQVTFVLVIFVFFINALFKRDILESLLFSVALAVGLTPELLPMILSINLSNGALAMSKKGVIVKRLSSIQNFGTMDVLCTDKTGTLTENKIKLVLHVDLEDREDERVLLFSYLNSYFQTGLKSPLDEAILAYRNLDICHYSKVDEVPFDFVRRRVSVVVDYEDQRLLVTKGAPESILEVCSYCEYEDRTVDMTPELAARVESQYRRLSSEGFRVLAIAYRKLKERKPSYSIGDEVHMVFLGLVAFLDPPKEGARESLRLLKSAGIELKILTGDNELVTKKVCDDLDFEIKGLVLGSEIAQMHDDALSRVVEEANVFARLTPVQKDRIIAALRQNGHVVGFLGDGINDAPSMRTADVGISVDNAVDVAKEAADIILLRKSLTVLEEGVIEGRKTFGNTMKYIMMNVSSNFGNMFSVAGASLFLPFLPMRPTQILLNNLLYDFSQFTITTDHVDRDYHEKPKRWDISFIKRFMVVFGPISSLFDFITFFTMLYVFSADEPLFQTAWFTVSLCTQTLIVFAIRTRAVPFFRSRPSRTLAAGSLAIVAAGLLVPFSPIAPLFSFTIPPAGFYVFLALVLGAYFLITESVKRWFYRRYYFGMTRSAK